MTTEKTKQYTELSRSQAGWLKGHFREITDLPKPGKKWTARDVDFGREMVLKLRQKELIERVYDGTRSSDGRSNKFYRTTKEAYEALERYKRKAERSDSFFPCGHSAILNERGVDGITCGECGKVYDKSEVSA